MTEPMRATSSQAAVKPDDSEIKQSEGLLTWCARDDAYASIPPTLRNPKAYETEMI